MIHVVTVSGGLSSAYLAYLFAQRERRERIDVKYVFCDTGAEHPGTYKFLDDLVSFLDIELICLRCKVDPTMGNGTSYRVIDQSECKQDLIPFYDVIHKYGTPSVGAPLCTKELKSRPSDKYCNDMIGRGNYIKWLGIRIDEPRRIKIVDRQIDLFNRAKRDHSQKIPLRYLGEIDDSDKQDIQDFWSQQPISLEIPQELGNCIFCIKKSIPQLALAARLEPAMAQDFHDLLCRPEVPTAGGCTRAGITKEQVFRNRMTLPQIIETYQDISTTELKQQVRRTKVMDAGSCSESCESMSIEGDLFE